ncbi:MAG TPA: hypothetical protein VNO31_34410, partial [Umezawaea sp.]|nr:hypothetical protein [Umezawaea sp.]
MRRVVDLLLTRSFDPRGEHVSRLVHAELGEDTALRALHFESANGAVSERTRERVALALEAAVEGNVEFGRALEAAVDDNGWLVPPAAP